MSPKPGFPLLGGLDYLECLGVTEDFDDLAQAEIEVVSKIRQPTTRRTSAMVPEDGEQWG